MPTHIRPLLVTAALFVGVASADAQPRPADPNAPGPVATRPTAPPIPIPLPDVPPVTAGSRPTPAPAASPPPLQSVYVPPPPSTDRTLAFEPYWNNGLYFRTTDRQFVAHLGGVLQYDAAWYTGGRGVQSFPGGVGRFDDGVNARRLRVMLDGTWYDSFDYKLEVEFMNGFSPAGLTGRPSVTTVSDSPGPTDAYVTVKHVPWVGNVRIGNQKEWFSLEHMESARLLLFMERSPLFDASQPSAFNNGRSPGISAFRTWANDSLFTAIGVYKNVSDLLGFGLGDGDYAVTGRLGVLPVWLPHLQTYWHVGGAMSRRDPVNGQVQVRVRNSVRNAPFPLLNLIADTGPIAAERQTLFNLETAFASGPLTVSGEFTTNLIEVARVGGVSPGTLSYHGVYAQASYFLTGEHREWDPQVGFFKRVTPLRNFDPRGGSWGGWEVGARVSHLDVDSRGVNGGRLSNATLGLTWYWTANMRVQLNYDYLYRDGGANPLARGSIHSLGTRLALDF
jgi:phosphate-selective porin OprO/OprP